MRNLSFAKREFGSEESLPNGTGNLNNSISNKLNADIYINEKADSTPIIPINETSGLNLTNSNETEKKNYSFRISIIAIVSSLIFIISLKLYEYRKARIKQPK